jgi:predicted RecB family nuclease
MALLANRITDVDQPPGRITASTLYDLVICEHRPWMDLYGDRRLRDDATPFLELLWRRGRAHEEEVVSAAPGSLLNLRVLPVEEREAATLGAMRRKEPLIYGGRLSSADLLGEPDLLRCENGAYVPGDIKAGAGDEATGDDEARRPKKHYGVQLALYVDVLEQLGHSDGNRRAFVWDVHGNEVPYDLTAPKGKRTPETLWDDYKASLAAAREIISGVRNPGPAYQAACQKCRWLTACLMTLESRDDLTLLPGLGRAKREPLLAHATSVSEFAAKSPEQFLDEKGRSTLHGLGPDSIAKFHARALLKSTKGSPYLYASLDLPKCDSELFFDIETDPGRDHCYLHGFVERRNGNSTSERYIGFFAEAATHEGERKAFASAWQYISSKFPCVIYVYSKYERTWWRTLQARYPDVCTEADVESMFDPGITIDLLQIVQSNSEWPTMDHSIKTIAKYLGFSWRDPHPSGAASIAWYDNFVQGEIGAKERILAYNEDDCRAMRVLLV